MPSEHVVFLFDVDNTLIDNDHIVADMKRNLERDIGSEQQPATGNISRNCAPSSATPTTSAHCNATASIIRATSGSSQSPTS